MPFLCATLSDAFVCVLIWNRHKTLKCMYTSIELPKRREFHIISKTLTRFHWIGYVGWEVVWHPSERLSSFVFNYSIISLLHCLIWMLLYILEIDYGFNWIKWELVHNLLILSNQYTQYIKSFFCARRPLPL